MIYFVFVYNIGYHHYLGCFVAGPADPELEDWQKISASFLTLPQCLEHCQSTGMRYAILQNGDRCVCDFAETDYNAYGEVAEAECNVTCGGDQSTTCGGVQRNAVYQIVGRSIRFQSPAIDVILTPGMRRVLLLFPTCHF